MECLKDPWEKKSEKVLEKLCLKEKKDCSGTDQMTNIHQAMSIMKELQNVQSLQANKANSCWGQIAAHFIAGTVRKFFHDFHENKMFNISIISIITVFIGRLAHPLGQILLRFWKHLSALSNFHELCDSWFYTSWLEGDPSGFSGNVQYNAPEKWHWLWD